MKTAPSLIVLTATLALAPLAALASPYDHGRAMIADKLRALNFAQIDADGDGAITLPEWRAYRAARMEARRSERLGTRIEALLAGDRDGDGLLSRDELTARLAALQDERHALREARRHERGHGRRGDDGDDRRARRGEDDAERAVRSFQRIDRDGDGRITAAELAREVERITVLHRVAVNLAIDRLRRRRNLGLDAIDEPEDGRPPPEAALIQADRMAALDAALAALPDRQRAAVVLRHIEGMTNPEIAAQLDIGVEAVESLTARGKRRLAELLAGRRAELGFEP